MKTIMLIVFMTGVVWGQRSQACKACPDTATIDAQFPRQEAKPAKPEKAKLQREPKRHGKDSKKSLSQGALEISLPAPSQPSDAYRATNLQKHASAQ